MQNRIVTNSKPCTLHTGEPSFSEHADISDKRNALKLNLYSDDSDESDYYTIPFPVIVL